MTAQDVCNWLTSEEGKFWIEVAKNTGLGLGWGVMVIRWLWGKAFVTSPEVTQLVNGLKDAEPIELEMEDLGHTPENPKYLCVPVLCVRDSGLCVRDCATYRELVAGQGVVYDEGIDQSGLYSIGELRIILAASQARRREVNEDNRSRARKALAAKVPVPRKISRVA